MRPSTRIDSSGCDGSQAHLELVHFKQIGILLARLVCRLHEFCAEDKMIIQAALTTQLQPTSRAWDVLPCDVLHRKREA